MRCLQGLFQVFARAGAGIDATGIAQTPPAFQVKTAALALRIRSKRAAYVRAFVPFETKPAQVFKHCLNKLRLASLKVEVFIAKDQLASGSAGAPVCDPEGPRMA